MKASLTQLLIGLGVCASLLAGCPSPSDSAGDAKKLTLEVPPRPAADISTPEQAVKSYWALRDWLQTKHEIEWKRTRQRADASKTGELMSLVAVRGVLDSFKESGPPMDQYERILESVKAESDTRALVTARIRVVNRVEAGITPTPIELFENESGGQIRYVVEKEQDGWKVAEVWRVDEPAGPRRIR
jgi:hypothetical protein